MNVTFIKTEHHENNNENNDKDNNYNNNKAMIITITMMVLLFDRISLTQWVSRTELRLSKISLWVKYMFRKRCKAHRHILFILQNIERRDLITICFGPPQRVEVRWGDLFILLEKKFRIQNFIEKIWITAIEVLSWKRVQLSDECVS